MVFLLQKFCNLLIDRAEGRRIPEKEVPLKSCCSSWRLWLSSSWNCALKFRVSQLHVGDCGRADWSRRRPQSPGLSAQKLHAQVGGRAHVRRDAEPLAPTGPSLSCSPFNLCWTTPGTRKDENERGFLPYLWKLQRNVPQSGSDDPRLSAKHTYKSEIRTLIRTSFWKVGFNPMSQMITTNSDQEKPKSTANFNLANA